ncbi:MAG: N-acetylmuramoyl-L-alanine amidase [Candidatus Krumholzibacteriota bacterium]|nr:N-acetylmuramoyl-L-alanine amidase [Candidatus Krumholzibacteriota bacterium]
MNLKINSGSCKYSSFAGKNILRGIFLVAALLAAVNVCHSTGVPAKEDEGKTLGVVFADGRRTEDITLSKVESESEELYISAYDLARIFKATKYWKPGRKRLVVRIGAEKYIFTLDTRVVTADDKSFLLRVPVRYRGGFVMIPLEFIRDHLAKSRTGKIEFDEKRFVLTIGDPSYNVKEIAFEESDEGTRAVLTLKDELLYHVDNETPGLLRLKIYGGRMNTLKISATECKGLFKRVRAEQTEYDAYLFFEVQQSARRFRVEFLGPAGEDSEDRKLVIFLEKGELPEIPDADFASKKMVEILREKTAEQINVEVKRVVIDPGHGGDDAGRVSDSGIEEKLVNLEISRMLKRMLIERLGVEVVLTRRTDKIVPLDRRGEIANVQKGDLFISIHCNGWFSEDAGGFETFFLSPARNYEESRQAEQENSSIRFEGSDLDSEKLEELDFILWDMVQNEFINESSDLAEIIQKSLGERLNIRNRGVRQAGLRVLRGVKMPAVLVEIAFLSNPREEKLLMDNKFRRVVCEGIVEAVRDFSANGLGAQAP